MANTHKQTLYCETGSTQHVQRNTASLTCLRDRVELIGCLSLSLSLTQGGFGFSGHHAPGVGCVDGPLWTRADRPCGGSAVRSVQRPPRGVRRLRLHGESVGPWDGGVSTHTAGTHQQSVLATGKLLMMLLWGPVFSLKGDLRLWKLFDFNLFLSHYSLMVSLWWAAHWTLQSESGMQRQVQTYMCQINFIYIKFIKWLNVLCWTEFFSNILSLLYHWRTLMDLTNYQLIVNKIINNN